MDAGAGRCARRAAGGSVGRGVEFVRFASWCPVEGAAGVLAPDGETELTASEEVTTVDGWGSVYWTVVKKWFLAEASIEAGGTGGGKLAGARGEAAGR